MISVQFSSLYYNMLKLLQLTTTENKEKINYFRFNQEFRQQYDALSMHGAQLKKSHVIGKSVGHFGISLISL